MNRKQLQELVLSSFDAERLSNIPKGLGLVADDFKVTEMSLGSRGDERLPSVVAKQAKKMIGETFQIKGRGFQFVNVVADEEKQVVFVEFVESYPDPATGQPYKTPQVAVCEIRNGKIHRTRHYNDPRASFVRLTQKEIDQALS